MQKIFLKAFKGLRTKNPLSLEGDESPLCNDIQLTPKGALGSPNGSTKWNNDSLGYINGFFDYHPKRGGQYIASFYSDSGAGYGFPPALPSGTGSETPDGSGVFTSDTPSSPAAPIVKVYTAYLTTTNDYVWDRAGLNLQYGNSMSSVLADLGTVYVITVKDQFGATATGYNTVSAATRIRVTYNTGYWSINNYRDVTITNGVGSALLSYYGSDYINEDPLSTPNNDVLQMNIQDVGSTMTATLSSLPTLYVYGVVSLPASSPTASWSGGTAELKYMNLSSSVQTCTEAVQASTTTWGRITGGIHSYQDNYSDVLSAGVGTPQKGQCNNLTEYTIRVRDINGATTTQNVTGPAP